MQLFQPDNFSASVIIYRQLNHDAAVQLLPVLNLYFQDYTIKYAGQLEGTEINSNNFKIELKVEGKIRKILLRKFKALKNQEQIIFYLNFLRDLKCRGVKVSEVVASKEGELTVECGGNYYAIFDFIEAGYFIPLEESYLSLAQEVAMMHQAFDSLGGKYVQRIEELSEYNQGVYFNKIKSYSIADFDRIEEIIGQKEKKEEADDFIFRTFFLIKELVKKVKEDRNKIPLLPKKIIHSDLHPHNVLMCDNEVAAIVDFDGIRLSERSRDIGFAIYRFGRQFFINEQISEEEIKNQAVTLRKKFLEKYLSILPLTQSEIEQIPFLLIDEFLTKILFVLRGVYEENNATWIKDLPKFLVAIEEINFFWP